MAKIEIGDLVKLKSGSEKMVVAAVHFDQAVSSVDCLWADTEMLTHRDNFPVAACYFYKAPPPECRRAEETEETFHCSSVSGDEKGDAGIKVGDVVIHNSGGQHMTVEILSETQEGRSVAKCLFFDDYARLSERAFLCSDLIVSR